MAARLGVKGLQPHGGVLGDQGGKTSGHVVERTVREREDLNRQARRGEVSEFVGEVVVGADEVRGAADTDPLEPRARVAEVALDLSHLRGGANRIHLFDGTTMSASAVEVEHDVGRLTRLQAYHVHRFVLGFDRVGPTRVAAPRRRHRSLEKDDALTSDRQRGITPLGIGSPVGKRGAHASHRGRLRRHLLGRRAGPGDRHEHSDQQRRRDDAGEEHARANVGRSGCPRSFHSITVGRLG